AAGAAVDDEVVRPLRDLRVEVVHQHPQHGLLRPALAAELQPARRADRACAPHASTPTAPSTAAANSPLVTSSSAAARSGAVKRSAPGPSMRERTAASAAAPPAPGC